MRSKKLGADANTLRRRSKKVCVYVRNGHPRSKNLAADVSHGRRRSKKVVAYVRNGRPRSTILAAHVRNTRLCSKNCVAHASNGHLRSKKGAADVGSTHLRSKINGADANGDVFGTPQGVADVNTALLGTLSRTVNAPAPQLRLEMRRVCEKFGFPNLEPEVPNPGNDRGEIEITAREAIPLDCLIQVTLCAPALASFSWNPNEFVQIQRAFPFVRRRLFGAAGFVAGG